MNVDLHSSKESNDENDCLIVPFNGLTRGKKVLQCLKMDKISRAQKK